jgi:hypothetical protein
MLQLGGISVIELLLSRDQQQACWSTCALAMTICKKQTKHAHRSVLFEAHERLVTDQTRVFAGYCQKGCCQDRSHDRPHTEAYEREKSLSNSNSCNIYPCVPPAYFDDSLILVLVDLHGHSCSGGVLHQTWRSTHAMAQHSCDGAALMRWRSTHAMAMSCRL